MEAIPWGPSRSVAERYIHAFEAVASRYVYNWQEAEAWSRRAGKLDATAGLRAPREAVADALLRYNRRIGNDAAALAAIDGLRQQGSLVVCGGQQAGLLTGPLFVIYKAISVIRAARKAADRLGRPVVPVFWIAGEDHDFAEVNHVHVLSSRLSIERIGLELPRDEAVRRLAISRRKIAPEQWKRVMADFEAVLPRNAQPSGLPADLPDMLLASETLSDAFARLMASLFGKYGLVLLDADDPDLRRLEVPFFHNLIDGNAELERALAMGMHAVERLGFPAQAEVKDGAANLFFMEAGERFPLFRQPDGTFADRSGRRFRPEELRRLAAEDAACLSNNVFTRPLMQEYVLPVLAAVLGPGEIAYWGQLKEAFGAFGMDMPVLLPRTSYLLVEGAVRKQMEKLGLSLADAVFRLEPCRQAWLGERDELGIERHFAEVKKRFADLYAPTVALAAKVDPGLKNLGETNGGKILDQMAYLEAKVKAAHRARHEAAMRHFDRIRLSLTPLGKQQERVYNGFPFIHKYGSAWIGALIDTNQEPLAGHHHIHYFVEA